MDHSRRQTSTHLGSDDTHQAQDQDPCGRHGAASDVSSGLREDAERDSNALILSIISPLHRFCPYMFVPSKSLFTCLDDSLPGNEKEKDPIIKKKKMQFLQKWIDNCDILHVNII